MKVTHMLQFCALLMASASSMAQQRPTCSGPQLGTWILLSMESVDLETNEKHDLLGVHPGGYLTYGADCRMSAILVKESRQRPASLVATDAESVDLYRGMMAYAGSYTIDGNTITQHIEASWNQYGVDTTEIDQFSIDGKSLYVRTGPNKSPLTGRSSRTEYIWTRVE